MIYPIRSRRGKSFIQWIAPCAPMLGATAAIEHVVGVVYLFLDF